MSAQSGIGASDELLERFKRFEIGILVIKVSEDSSSLEVDDGFNGHDGDANDLKTTFSRLSEYVRSIYPRPVYIVFGQTASDLDTERELGFISFIPDSSPVRQKMLYASTKNTLMTQLGTNSFKKDFVFSWTELDELTYGNLVQSTKASSSAALTEDERLLKQIDSLQGLTLATSSDKSHVPNIFKQELVSMHKPTSSGSGGGTLMFDLQDELKSEIESSLEESLAGKVHGLVAIDICVTKEEFKLATKHSNVEVSRLNKTLQDVIQGDVHPYYAIYNYSGTGFAFIYTCPSGSRVKDRMIYASNKQGLLDYLRASVGEKGLTIDHVVEVGDVDEMDTNIFKVEESSLKSQATANNLKFTKPKGPRRK